MRRISSLATLAVLSASTLAAVATPALAQSGRILTMPERRVFTLNDDRPMIGVSTETESSRGDTLGLRITEVLKDSPAEKAGLKVGDRLQSVNGVSLRADRADAGESDYSGVLNRRLQREVAKTKAGDELELRVLSGTQARTLRMKPEKLGDVMTAEGFGGAAGGWRSMAADRAVIGISVNSTGSVRDTAGVFVTSVTKDGPAEKAGIVEGDRIAAINGVSLKVSREDAEDISVASRRVDRLQREVAKLEAGQAAELTVISGGRSRTVRVNAVKASDLPDDGETFTFSLPDGASARMLVPGVRGFERRQTPDGAVRMLELPGGELRMRQVPRGEMRLRESQPRLNEMLRRLETERGAPVRSGRFSSRVIV